MTFIFGKLVWAVTQPGNLLLLCLLVGVFLLLRGRRRGELLVVLSAIGLLLLSVAPIGPAMLLALEQRFPRPAMLPEKIDGIVVLGGAVDPAISRSYGETAFNGSAARVLGGIALARRYPEAKLALVGGEGGFLPVGFAESRATLGPARVRNGCSSPRPITCRAPSRHSGRQAGRSSPTRLITRSTPRPVCAPISACSTG